MIEVNKFKIGVFAVSGIVVLLGAVLIFGGNDIFKDEVKLVTVYNESVQGLEKGSQVKFRGVPVGKVTEIAILQNDSKIRIKMQIDPDAFVLPDSNNAEIMVSRNTMIHTTLSPSIVSMKFQNTFFFSVFMLLPVFIIRDF